MTITPNDEFAKRMLLMAKPAGQFCPTATYDPDGDCIEFLAKPDPFYAERVDELVTVYYSHDTGEVVGSLIKGVSSFCEKMLEKMPGFQIEICDGGVSIKHLFLVQMWAKPLEQDDLTILTYRKLIDVSEDVIVKGEFSLC